MSKFRVGDVVYLKSGSPAMTIREIRDDNTCHCDWFVNNEKQQGIFNSEQLTTEDPDELPPGANVMTG